MLTAFKRLALVMVMAVLPRASASTSYARKPSRGCAHTTTIRPRNSSPVICSSSVPRKGTRSWSTRTARAYTASDGCIALANPDIEELAKRVQVGVTPVIIAQQVEWVTQSAWRIERDGFTRQMESWRTAWESRDTDRYLAHYARDFRSDGMNIAGWSAHKRRVNAAKTWIKVALTNVTMFRTPGQQDLIAVTFDQDYRSDNLAQQTRKRQYWVMEDGRWKIAYEAPVRSAVLALPESYPGRRR